MRIIGLFLLAILMLFSTAQATNITHHAIYKGYNEEQGYPFDLSTNFTDFDPEVVSWLFLENLTEGDSVTWEFYMPNGDIFFKDELYINFSEETGWAYNSNPTKQFLSIPGQWKVVIYINDIKKAEDSFYVTNVEFPNYLIGSIIILFVFLASLMYKMKIGHEILYRFKYILFEEKVSKWIKLYSIVWFPWAAFWTLISITMIWTPSEDSIYYILSLSIGIFLLFVILPLIPIYLSKPE